MYVLVVSTFMLKCYSLVPLQCIEADTEAFSWILRKPTTDQGEGAVEAPYRYVRTMEDIRGEISATA